MNFTDKPILRRLNDQWDVNPASQKPGPERRLLLHVQMNPSGVVNATGPGTTTGMSHKSKGCSHTA